MQWKKHWRISQLHCAFGPGPPIFQRDVSTSTSSALQATDMFKTSKDSVSIPKIPLVLRVAPALTWGNGHGWSQPMGCQGISLMTPCGDHQTKVWQTNLVQNHVGRGLWSVPESDSQVAAAASCQSSQTLSSWPNSFEVSGRVTTYPPKNTVSAMTQDQEQSGVSK